jgi:hypothetical protein
MPNTVCFACDKPLKGCFTTVDATTGWEFHDDCLRGVRDKAPVLRVAEGMSFTDWLLGLAIYRDYQGLK